MLRQTKWLIVAVAAAALGLASAIASEDLTTNDQTSFLPHDSQSTIVSARQSTLPSGRTLSTLIVYARDGQKLTSADQAKIASDLKVLAPYDQDQQVGAPIPSADGQAEIVSFNMPRGNGNDVTDKVAAIRDKVHQHAPPGLQIKVTGGGGFAADSLAAFNGLNSMLLLASVAVVAVLLILTYRSPWLWLVPLIVVGAADQTASAIVNELSKHAGLVLNGENTGILRVLVFGAGTDYALLLIARYREELHRYGDRHRAMARALREAAPAILASGMTVILALASLAFSSLNSDRSLAPVGVVGIGCALIFGLVVLPAALVLFDRQLFWPRVPRLDQAAAGERGPFVRLGAAVEGAPGILAVIFVAVLGIMLLGLKNYHLGLPQAQAYRSKLEAVAGQDLVSQHYSAGVVAPLTVIGTTIQQREISRVLTADPHVTQVIPTEQTARWTVFTVIVSDVPDSPANYETIKRLRHEVGDISGGDAVVGGSSAVDLDTNDAAAHDRRLVIPIVLAIVFVVLVGLLRSLVAPLVLIATVVLSYFAALGASNVIYVWLFHFSAVDAIVPLLGFVFLVALGVDYNIFLVTRATEEVSYLGARRGMIRALVVTGGVITSAGLVLAATFSVLSILPLVVMTQIGIIVALGVLIDTFLVRSIVVPALAVLLGPAFWWPRRFDTLADAPKSSYL